MTTILSGAETADDLERMTHETGIELPEGYTRVAVVMTQTGAYLVVTGEGLPAMGLMNRDGEAFWARAFKSGGAIQ